MKKKALVALGGNALLRGNNLGSIEEQEANTNETIENLIFLIKEGYNLVVTHGNGPQVGNILMRNDAGEQQYGIVQMPINVCVADSQGGIGYMIERMLRNVLNEHKIDREVITIVSMVCVDPNDKAFENPSKRIGKIYTKSEAEELETKKGWSFKTSTKREGAYRRVVPSPIPQKVLNSEIIKQLVDAGTIVITAGGGGIPVYYDENKDLRTVNGVVDKDLASSVLANQIEADEFYILTDVPYIYENFGLPTQKKLEFLDLKDTKSHLKKGTFKEGTMEPKINAAIRFIENGGSKSVITEAKKLEDRSFGSKITMNYE
ncbi:MAG: carbamate kinase [Prolixibacteraceae bacterium]|jgi:carbamate kinase|nr:carbamate kinase [Prolixibacteraceae bacterium]